MNKKEILANYLEVDVEEIISEGGNDFSYDCETYIVLDEDEVYDVAISDFDNYMEDVIQEIPSHLREYFDKDRFQDNNFDSKFDWMPYELHGDYDYNGEAYYIYTY